jgi:hypothetical protein
MSTGHRIAQSVFLAGVMAFLVGCPKQIVSRFESDVADSRTPEFQLIAFIKSRAGRQLDTGVRSRKDKLDELASCIHGFSQAQHDAKKTECILLSLTLSGSLEPVASTATSCRIEAITDQSFTEHIPPPLGLWVYAPTDDQALEALVQCSSIVVSEDGQRHHVFSSLRARFDTDKWVAIDE